MMPKIHFFIHLVIFLIWSCEFKASPYTARANKALTNQTQLEVIKSQAPEHFPRFKIAFISDTHNYFSRLDKLIHRINKNGPYSFVVITGDITNYGLLEEYNESRKFFNKLNFPYLVAIGNHDLLSNGDLIYEKLFGESDFTFVYHNLQMIIINNNNWESSGTVPNRAWLESTLRQSVSPFKIIAAHISPRDEKRFSENEQREWERIMATYGVQYFMSGHNHNPEEEFFGGAINITIGAPSKGSYYELIVTPHEVTHQKIHF